MRVVFIVNGNIIKNGHAILIAGFFNEKIVFIKALCFSCQ
jgi:hypothetical protein